MTDAYLITKGHEPSEVDEEAFLDFKRRTIDR
jgi:hypothetical protein